MTGCRSIFARSVAGTVLACLGVSPPVLADAATREAIRKLLDDGRYVEAERDSRALVQRVEREEGGDSLEAARALDLLAESLRRAGRLAEPETLEAASRALRIKERTLGPDAPELGESLINLGGLAYASADYAEAKKIYDRSLMIRERAFGLEDSKTAESLSCVGSALLALGDYDAARSTLERALAIRERVLGPDHPDAAWTLMSLGAVLERTGDLDGARSSYERALAIRERWLRPDHPETARTVAHLGNHLEAVGDYAAARRLTRKAYEIRAASLPPDHPDIARSLDGMGRLEMTLGDYGEAGKLIERAMAILTVRYGPEHPELAGMISNLGWLAEAIGDYPEAERLYRRARSIEENALGPDSPDGTWTAVSLASALHAMRRDAEARDLLERAKTIRETAYGAQSPYVATVLKDLARVTRSLGDAEAAEALCRQAVGIYSNEPTGDDSPELADARQVLAGLLASRGDLDGALQLASRVQAIVERTFGADHPLAGDPLGLVAELRLRKGELDAAFEAALRAEEVGRALLVSTAGALSERQALRYAATRPSGLDIVFSVAARGADAVLSRRAWDALVQSRALVLDEMARRHGVFRHAEDPGTALALEAWERASEKLANLMVRGPLDMPAEHYARLLRDARLEKERTERTLGEASRAFRRDRDSRRVGPDEVLRALPPGSAMVSYVRYVDRANDTNPVSGPAPLAAVPSYLAFVLMSGQAQPALVPLGPAARLDGLVREWRRWAASPPSPEPSGSAAEEKASQIGAELRRLIWDPLEPRFAGARSVFVVPDVALQLVNLAALPRKRGGYLVEDERLIQHLSAERDIAVAATSPAPGGVLLAVGDPAYDDRAILGLHASRVRSGDDPSTDFRGTTVPCPSFERLRFQRLPATGMEVAEIATVWSARHDASVARLIGAEATETAFKQQAPRARVLHLATHGFVEAACEPSAATVRGISALAFDKHPLSAETENPLRLSGLVFAGANHRSAAGPAEDDGILTAEEVASIDLSNVEWAVLSACDTGLGELQAGEGVLGLRRAFQIAGAKTLIMSLWGVDDEATRRWMKALYEARIREGKSSAAAVREASLRVLRARRAGGLSTRPFYWAGFIAAGDWR